MDVIVSTRDKSGKIVTRILREFVTLPDKDDYILQEGDYFLVERRIIGMGALAIIVRPAEINPLE